MNFMCQKFYISNIKKIFYRISQRANILKSSSWNRRFDCFILTCDKETVDNFRRGAHTHMISVYVQNIIYTHIHTHYTHVQMCESARGCVGPLARRKGGSDAEKRQRAFRLAHCGTAERQCRQLAVARQNR